MVGMPDRAPTRPIPGAEQLLERLDPLPVPDQRAFVVRLAREHAADPGLAALIEDWAGAGTFQRRWAAVMATETGATRPLEPLLSDPSPLVRHAAVTGWLRLAEQRPELAERLAVHVDRWPRSARERFPTSVRWQRRPRVAAALVSWAWERYDEVAIHLLRWCDADTVARMLPEVGLVDPLVARHPELVARYLHDHPGVLSEEWGATWGYGTRELSAAFLERRPDLLPPLVDRHTPDTLPPGLVACVPRLLAALPEWTLRRLGDPETMRRLTADQPSPELRRALAALPEDVLARFLTLARPYPEFVRALATYRPGEPREVVYAELAAAAEQSLDPGERPESSPAERPGDPGERLAADPAAIRDRRVRFVLARKHTELLDHLLSPGASRYASAAELAGWLLELTYQRQAWTPRRQRQFADRVTALMPDAVADRGVPVRQRCRLLRRYAALPQVAGGDLVPWLERAPADRSGSLRAPRHSWPRSESEDLLLAQAALYGLLRSPDPEPALRYVLRHLIDTPLWLDPTASALTARRMPPARLRALLSELLPRALSTESPAGTCYG